MLPQDQRDVLIAKDAELLAQVDFKYFRLNPTSIRPFQSAQLSWRVLMPAGLRLQINGQQVSASGSMTVAPHQDTTYNLVVKGRILQTSLKTVRLDLNDADCRIIEIGESLIAISVENMMQDFVANNPGLKVRSFDNLLSLTPGKITLNLPLTITIDNWFDADADIQAVYTINIQQAEPRYVLRARLLSSSIDVSFDWWEHALSLGLNAAGQAMAEEILKGFLHGFFGTQIKMDMETQMNDTVRQLLGSNERLFDVSILQDAIQLKVCPA